MRHAYAHDAVLALALGADIDHADIDHADINAPGAAVTTELCGHWEHPPPCPLAPHHTAARRDGHDVHLRILFATEPEREAEVRTRIARALTAEWEVRDSRAGSVRPDEQAHAERLAASPS